MIDYLCIMLVSIASGLVVLALYLHRRPLAAERPEWAMGFAAPGFLALVTGLPMVVVWPLPGSYNIAFGEPALFYGVVFLAASHSVARRSDPILPGVIGLFGSATAILIGLRLWDLGLTDIPWLAALAYVAAGLGGLLALPALLRPGALWLSRGASVFLVLGAGVLAVTGGAAYWQHLQGFVSWLPFTMQR